MSNDFFTTSSRIKSTPYTSRNEEAGVLKYTVYNRTLIPTIFKSLQEDYFHLINYVQLWDVSVQKVIEIKGKSSLDLIKFLFCRNFDKVSPGKAYYAPIVNFKGGLLNDPVVFCVQEDTFLISIADSDLFNWISAINEVKKFQNKVIMTEISTIAVQGPKSEALMSKIFYDDIKNLKFFNFKNASFNNDNIFISKTGFSKQSGFEILISNPNTGIILWDLIMEKGKEFNVRVGCPNMIERVESNLLSYGNEMTEMDLPYDCGLGKFCNLDAEYDFIGKSALLEQKKIGFKKSIYRVEFSYDSPLKPIFYSYLPVFYKNEEIGKVTSIVDSPKYSKYIGFLIVDKTIEQHIDDYYIFNNDKIKFVISEII
jgi:dimethylsulfoniopropionate demethylase